MIIEMIRRWEFRNGFRAGHADAKAKRPRSISPGSNYASGYRLGIACYALSLDPASSMKAAEHDWFCSGGDSAR